MKRLAPLITGLLFFGCWSTPKPISITKVDPSYVGRGEYLVKSVAACGFCHGENPDPESPLSGGRIQADPLGEVPVPNITPHNTGVADWDINRLVAAIRNSVDRGGEPFSPHFHQGSEWMSDTDAISIAAYLQSVPPVDNKVSNREIGFFTRNTLGLLEITSKELPGYVPAIDKGNSLARGEYLVDHVARCARCHNTPATMTEKEVYFKGGMRMMVDGEEKTAPALIGDDMTVHAWSQEQIVKYLRTGITPLAHVVDPKFCPISFYKMADQDDVEAIATFLRSLAGTDVSSGN